MPKSGPATVCWSSDHAAQRFNRHPFDDFFSAGESFWRARMSTAPTSVCPTHHCPDTKQWRSKRKPASSKCERSSFPTLSEGKKIMEIKLLRGLLRPWLFYVMGLRLSSFRAQHVPLQRYWTWSEELRFSSACLSGPRPHAACTGQEPAFWGTEFLSRTPTLKTRLAPARDYPLEKILQRCAIYH